MKTKTNLISQLITTARQERNMNLREFGEALGISHQQAKNYEGGQLPDGFRVASWIESPERWVRLLGLEIFNARFGMLVQFMLTPNEPRVALTRQGRRVLAREAQNAPQSTE